MSEQSMVVPSMRCSSQVCTHLPACLLPILWQYEAMALVACKHLTGLLCIQLPMLFIPATVQTSELLDS
jgi:hypothetical protein